MKTMHYCIQCTDDRTGKVGTFGFTHGRYVNGKVRYNSLTPVFPSLVELFHYCRENNIELRDTDPILETGTNEVLK